MAFYLLKVLCFAIIWHFFCPSIENTSLFYVCLFSVLYLFSVPFCFIQLFACKTVESMWLCSKARSIGLMLNDNKIRFMITWRICQWSFKSLTQLFLLSVWQLHAFGFLVRVELFPTSKRLQLVALDDHRNSRWCCTANIWIEINRNRNSVLRVTISYLLTNTYIFFGCW